VAYAASQGDRPPHLRAFGKYIAAVEIQARSTQNPRSAGDQKKWRRAGKRGPSPADRFESSHVYPGRLHVYDVETERVFSIATNEGDSEVLLIEDGNIYYRVNDQLYLAPISGEGIGTARLLATDEVIRDAHWVFVKQS
jgi:hypothetical protein